MQMPTAGQPPQHIGDPWECEIGGLPTGHFNAWIRLEPKERHDLVYARKAEGFLYSSQPTWRDMSHARDRHLRQNLPHKGFKSKRFPPGVADCSTVDELEMKVSTLNKYLPNPTLKAKENAEELVDRMFIEGGELHRAREGAFEEPTSVVIGKTITGEIKPDDRRATSQYCFYSAEVPDLDIPVGLEVGVKMLQGDPDVYVCNRNMHPTNNPQEHTWRSQNAGDDLLSIPPHDPSYFPGTFYISVFALRDSIFELTVRLKEMVVNIPKPMKSIGNGYKDVKAQIALADTRRRFCKHGAGFADQLESPRSLKGPTFSPRGAPTSHDLEAQRPYSARAVLVAQTPANLRPETAPEGLGDRRPSITAAAPAESARRPSISGISGAAPAESERPTTLPFATRQQLLKQTVAHATPLSTPVASPRKHHQGTASSAAASATQPPPEMTPLTPSRRLATQFEENGQKEHRALSPRPPPALRFGGRVPSTSPGRSRRNSRESMLNGTAKSVKKPGVVKPTFARSSSPTFGMAEREAWAKLSDPQKLKAYDESGADAMRTVHKYLGAQCNVAPDIIAHRTKVRVDERVRLNASEHRGMQNLLTARLRSTLEAQEDSRNIAYRLRAKASQHLDVGDSRNWSPERALKLVNSESLKIKDEYESALVTHVEELAAEARNAQARSARSRMIAAIDATKASVKLVKAAQQQRSMAAAMRAKPTRRTSRGSRESGDSQGRGSGSPRSP